MAQPNLADEDEDVIILRMPSKVTEKSIINDLKKYPGISDDVIQQANRLYIEMGAPTRRGQVRQQMLFICTYRAYRKLGKEPNPYELAQVFGLKKGQVQKANSIFSPLQTGFQPNYSQVYPAKDIPSFSAQIGLSEEVTKQIVTFAQGLLERYPSLAEEAPQNLAAGIIAYYCQSNGIIPVLATLPTVANNSKITIDNMAAKIAEYDNR